MTIKLLMYILTILLPFLPFKRTVWFNINNVKKKVELRKVYWILAWLMLAFISISTKTYTDVDIYTNIFNWTNAERVNYGTFGWSMLCRLFYYLGLNYRGMIPVILLISVFVVSRACRRINIDEDSLISLMLIFPGIMNVIQLKFFLAYSIIIYSVTFLQRNEKKSIFKYVVGILLATSIHSASAFCLVYLLVILFERVDIQKSILYTLVGVVIVIISLRIVPSLAAKFLNAQVVIRYFTGAVEVSSLNWIAEISLAWIFMVGIIWILICSGAIKISKQDSNNQNIERNKEALLVSRSFTIVSLNGLILPLLVFDQNFHRFIEIEYMIGYELIIFYFRNKLVKKISNKCIIICILLCAIIYCIRYFVPFDRVMPMFLLDEIVQMFR